MKSWECFYVEFLVRIAESLGELQMIVLFEFRDLGIKNVI